MQTHSVDGLTLNYLVIAGKNNGGKPWLIFHGYGQTPDQFAWVVGQLSDCSIGILVELPAHGQSTWDAPPIAPNVLGTWAESLMGRYADAHVSWGVLAYSIGGRPALAVLANLPHKLDMVVLIAAEGAGRSAVYDAATGTGLGRAAFKRAMHGQNLTKLAKVAQTLGLSSPTLARYATERTRTDKTRQRVLQSWLALRLLPGARPKELAKLAKKNKVRIRLFAGLQDKVVPFTRMLPLARAYDIWCLKIMQTGHWCVAEALEVLRKGEHPPDLPKHL